MRFYNIFLLGRLQIYQSTLQKLNISSLIFNNNWTKHITGHSSPTCQQVFWQSGFIFDEHFTYADQISALFEYYCYSQLTSEIRCILSYLSLETANIIATSIVFSKLDYCYSFYCNLPFYQTSRLRHTP